MNVEKEKSAAIHKALQECIREDHLSVLEPKLSVRISSSMALKEVIRTMVEKKIGAVLIVEEGELAGIFSERDIIHRVALNYDQLADQPIRNFMTPNPVKLSIRHNIAYALHYMDVGDYRHIPITDDENKPTGIVAARDIIRYLDQKCLGGPA